MLFMDNKIADRQFRKVLNTLSVIFFFLFALLLLFAENIRLCDHCKFDHRVFKPFSRMTISNHDLARFQNAIRIFPVKSA